MMMANTDDIEENNPFIEEEGITDVALVVEDKKLYVSKVLLSIVSPVFKKMFLNDFKEKDAKEVSLPGKKFEDVLEFLKVVYPNIQKPLNFDTITLILPLIHEYGCERQLKESENFLTTNIEPDEKGTPCLDKLLECLLQAHLYGLKESYEICLESASKYSFKKIRFNRFPDILKIDLLRKRLEDLERIGTDLVEKLVRIGDCRSESKFKEFGLFLDTKFQFDSNSYLSSYKDYFKK